MKLDGADASAALHIGKDPSEGEQQQREESMELRLCRTNQDGALFQHNTKGFNSSREVSENRCGLSGKRGHRTSLQGLAICLEHTKNSPGFGCNVPAGAAYHYGYDVRFKRCVSNGGANLNAADKRAGGTGLNLHFILVFLLSTNKLTPEKT
ncbi:unnamed protein product [Pleuronectes platessa]|uniref:Uncharacterized protein n=1 Tax=Pleuronectes platessa TaxID=8262 RepID=A0A9N7VS60_PLEPL|nr:unnamed protein product [Pleuronectes platessa]